MTHEEATAQIRKYGSIRSAASALHCSRNTLRRALANGPSGTAPAKPAKAKIAPKQDLGMYKTIEQVLRPLDHVGTALEVVAAIPDGRIMEDDVLRRQVGISDIRWRAVRGSTRMSGHWIALPDKSTVWGAKKTINALGAKLKEYV